MSLILDGTNGLSDVDGTAATPAIRGTDANTGIFFPAADTIAFSEGGAEVARFDSSGNLGIGTSSPTGYGRTLQVAQTAGDDATFSLGTASAGSTSNVYLNARPGSSANFFLGTQNGAILFATGLNTGTNIGTERMRINSNGYTMIGVTSALNDSRLSVSQSGASNAMFVATDGAGNRAIGFINSSTFVGDIVTSASSVAYNTSSDYRLKENVAPMTGALATVAQLKPCTYTWKSDGSSGQGFIAHELQVVVPDAVTGEKDAVETYTDKDGNEQTRIKPQGVDTSFLVATLTAAIQELKAIVDAQAIEIAELKVK
jgi:hypothetical protein